jgi:hypothetical protein
MLLLPARRIGAAVVPLRSSPLGLARVPARGGRSRESASMGSRMGSELCLVGVVSGGAGEQRGGELRLRGRIDEVLLPKPVMGRGAVGGCPGRRRVVSNSVGRSPATSSTSNNSYLCWSVAYSNHSHTGEFTGSIPVSPIPSLNS